MFNALQRVPACRRLNCPPLCSCLGRRCAHDPCSREQQVTPHRERGCADVARHPWQQPCARRAGAFQTLQRVVWCAFWPLIFCVSHCNTWCSHTGYEFAYIHKSITQFCRLQQATTSTLPCFVILQLPCSPATHTNLLQVERQGFKNRFWPNPLQGRSHARICGSSQLRWCSLPLCRCSSTQGPDLMQKGLRQGGPFGAQLQKHRRQHCAL